MKKRAECGFRCPSRRIVLRREPRVLIDAATRVLSTFSSPNLRRVLPCSILVAGHRPARLWITLQQGHDPRMPFSRSYVFSIDDLVLIEINH